MGKKGKVIKIKPGKVNGVVRPVESEPSKRSLAIGPGGSVREVSEIDFAILKVAERDRKRNLELGKEGKGVLEAPKFEVSKNFKTKGIILSPLAEQIRDLTAEGRVIPDDLKILIKKLDQDQLNEAITEGLRRAFDNSRKEIGLTISKERL